MNLAWAISDIFVLFRRSTTHIIRSPDQLFALVIQPIMFMLLFTYIFGSAIDTGGTSYINYLVAGIIVQNAAFGATTTAVGIATDLQRGIIDRFRSLPMFTPAVLFGHTMADLVRNSISTVISIVVALIIGFRPTASFTEWLLVIALILVFTLAFSWLSVILGLLAKSIEAVQNFSFVAILPLTFASTAFVPTDGMPAPLKAFVENQPVTHVIDAMRAWLNGTPVGDSGWLAFAWSFGILIVAIPVAAYIFNRKTQQ